MEAEGSDDLLFSIPSSQDCLSDTWSDESDGEMLVTSREDGVIPWNLQSSPMLMAAVNGEEPLEQLDFLAETDSRSTVDTSTVGCTVNFSRNRHWVIARIEGMLEHIIDSLLEESDKLTITLRSRGGSLRRQANPSNKIGPSPRERKISFPGSNAQEAWNFTVFLRVLELIHNGLLDNTTMTKRDIYYRHPDLFMKQSVVDRCVDDLAYTFGISRTQLNVTAAAKGLVAGNFSITREDGTRVDCLNEKEGLLVPNLSDKDRLDLTPVNWILIVEKEASFRSLISSPEWERMGSTGVVLTAKGYPDLNSRKFLRQLANHAPHIPMYAFVDLDPDGIAIMSTYKYGSHRLAHEDTSLDDTPTLSLPDLYWLGVKSHQMSRLSPGDRVTYTNATPELQGAMKLTARDRTKAIQMLQWNLCAEEGPEKEWRKELQTMLMLNVKAEMQILDELPYGMVAWLSSELEQAAEPRIELLPDNTLPDNSSLDDGLLF